MAWKIYVPALAAAFAAFAVTGGIQASEKVIKAEEQRAVGVEATLPFANSGNIRDWRADGIDGLYVQDMRRQWYHAALFGPCNELMTANQVAFLTRGPDQLDRYSAIAVRGQRCAFSDFLTSAGPPVKAKPAKS